MLSINLACMTPGVLLERTPAKKTFPSQASTTVGNTLCPSEQHCICSWTHLQRRKPYNMYTLNSYLPYVAYLRLDVDLSDAVKRGRLVVPRT